MAEFEKEEFKFPDEIENNEVVEPEIDIEIEDDTPEEDRGRIPTPTEKVKSLEVEVDELDKYSKEAKDKMIQMKRIWNDERRRAEAAERERQAAVDAAQKLYEDNKRMRGMIQNGQTEYVSAIKSSTELQLEMAKKAYREAYDMGDSEKLLAAQEAMTRAQMHLDRVNNFKVQVPEERYVPEQKVAPVAKPDDRVIQWQNENPWFGQDEEMTATALGLHEKLKKQGVVIGSNDYYAKLDETMRKRFPENFEHEVDVSRENAPKKKTVVAPATRSTAPKKVKLSTSQVAIAKKLGLTPEQYVRELLRLEA